MERFSEFLKEEEYVHIDVDLKNSPLGDIEKINEDLDAVTANPFINSGMFVNSVRGTLERYGILLPAESNMQQLALEGEYIYALGDSGQFVYMVHNLDENGSVEGYANIVDGDELEDLKSLQDDEPTEDVEPQVSDWAKYPKARRDDDSGETAEYA